MAHGVFPNKDNPNTIKKQDYTFYIPLHPKPAAKPTKTPFGPIGVAINGIPFYNQYNAEGGDAVKLEVFDSCCGHPDQAGRYHYHKYPVCVKSPFKDPVGQHSPLIGYAFDGYAIYGPNGEDGKPPTDLDECNGHTDTDARIPLPRDGGLSVYFGRVSRRCGDEEFGARSATGNEWTARNGRTSRWSGERTATGNAPWWAGHSKGTTTR